MHHFGVPLSGKAFIEFHPVDFDPATLPAFQWVFFSSPQGVTYFLEKYPVQKLEGRKTAAVGAGTAARMVRMGLKPDYIAPEADPGEAGKRFAQQTADEVVLFPLSDISKKSVPNCFPPNRRIDLVVYQTRLLPPGRQRAEQVLIFTSPSNARAYFRQHALQPAQQVIAIGRTTAAELKLHCPPEKITVAAYPSEEGLWEALVY